MNTFGKNLRLTTFGESHGKAIGGIIDGFPSGFKINFEELYKEIKARRPGNSLNVTQRKEEDKPEFLSGITEDGITLGTPIGFIIRNQDTKSKDYSEIENKYRPNHADFTYEIKNGLRDYRGGGRASARETANWVVAGSLVQQWLKEKFSISIEAKLTAAGTVSFTEELTEKFVAEPLSTFSFEIPGSITEEIERTIMGAKDEGDSIGGIVSCVITGLPAGIGNPVFDKLHSRLSQAMMSINAAKGFEYGGGFNLAEKYGSESLDIFFRKEGKILTRSNYSGGIQGGISNGMPIFFNVAFKPTPTIMREVETIDKEGNVVNLRMKGRHDPCVAVRAVPVVKAMAALVVADFLV